MLGRYSSLNLVVSYPEPVQRPARSKRMRFRPPRPSRFVENLCGRFLPKILKRGYGITAVEYQSQELERLQEILGQRVLITPNHPTHAEPVILFHLSRTVGHPFFYLSNREAFDRAWGLFGWLLSRTGAYSIVRGAPDRDSFKFTRKVLSENKRPLVIFPEGEVYSQNDSLLPFQAGVFQLAFLALDDMVKASIDAPLHIQPVAIRYRFVEDMGKPIVESLQRLEQRLSLPSPPPGDSYQRLRRIGDAVLTAAEDAYKLPHGSADDMNPRIDAVREKIVERVADTLDMEPDSLGKTLPDKMRALSNRVNRVVTEEYEPASPYSESLLRQEADRIKPLEQDLKRLANWLAVKDGYVGELATQERMVDTLWRLESEVLGHRIISGQRECEVRLAEPFDLREYRNVSRKDAIAEVTHRVEESILKLLGQMALASTAR